ncbi:MAG: ParB/RepB/Spo0J family partition protein [Acidobacteriaceae bacterium]
MSTTESLTIPLNKLVPWKGNVRRHEPKAGLDELKASIEAHGLLQSLVVQKDKGGMYAVIAGRRRLFALQALAKGGSIKASYAVPCSVMDAEADPKEISLVENFQRQQMHPADEFEAFKALSDGGLSAAEIAGRNGITERHVEQRLKLANVSPKLIKAYREGECSLQHMMAFAVTTDHEAQERVWRDMPAYRRNDPEAVRDQLVEGEISAKDRRVKFVGLAAYEKAGGTIRRDLFVEDEDGAFILDKELLADLVAKKLEKIADGVTKEGWKWVEVRDNFEHAEWSKCSRRHEEAAPLPAKEQAKLDALNAELEALLESDDTDGENPEIDKLQAKIDKFEERPRSWQPDTLAIAGVVVSVGFNGKPEITRSLVKPEDAPKKASKKLATNGSGEPIEEPGLSASLTQDLTTHRTAALSAVLKDKPEVALAALVEALAGQVFYHGYGHNSPVKISLTEANLRTMEGSKAYESLTKAHEKWLSKLPGKEEELFAWCQKQKQPVLLDLLAYCVSRSVDAIAAKNDNPEGERFRHANALAKAVGLDMRDWFTATAENYFGRVSKGAIIDALKEAKVEITPAIEKQKKGELAATAERELGPKKWLPALLMEPK